MQDTRAVTDMGRGFLACAIGVALGIAMPGLLPGVALMCAVLFSIEFVS